MKLTPLFLALALGFTTSVNATQEKHAEPTVITHQVEQITITFDNSKHVFTEEEIVVVKSILLNASKRVRSLLPTGLDKLNIAVRTIDRNLDIVGGVFGRAEAPGEVVFYLSTATKGGVIASARGALESSVFHELHHLHVGWTMVENRYGNPSGIPIASINEGLAQVFSETYTDQYFPKAADYPEDVHEWFEEVLALPKNANYGHWVGGMHPDGRTAIGYRLGRYLIHQVQHKTNKSIVELSDMHAQELIEIAKN